MNKILAMFLTVSLFCAAANALDVGEKSTPLTGVTWVKGEGVDPSKPDGKHIYIVEFWATWCQPCHVSIPHLNGLHAKYKDKGLVIMGISNETKEKVDEFMTKLNMDYIVGLEPTNAVFTAYKGANQGIPEAFVIGKDGKLLWRGNPLAGLDRTVKLIMEGKFDLEVSKKIAAEQANLQAAAQKNDAKAVLAAVNEMIKLEPDNHEHHALRINIVKQIGGAAQVPALYDAWGKDCANNPEGLAALTNTLLNADVSNVRFLQKALELAMQAVKVSNGTSANAVLALARAYCALGAHDKALAVLAASESKVDAHEAVALKAFSQYVENVKLLHDAAVKE